MLYLPDTTQFNWGRRSQDSVGELISGKGSVTGPLIAPDYTGEKGAPYECYAHLNDTYVEEPSMMVHIRCAPKCVDVWAPITGGVRVTGGARWSEFFGAFGSVVKTMDNVGMALGAGSIKAPWLARKVWDSSDTLKLSLTINLVATGWGGMTADSDAAGDTAGMREVYLPACQLLSLVYPSEIVQKKEGSAGVYIPPGPNPLCGISGAENSGDMGTGGQLSPEGSVVGHVVSVDVGRYISLSGCFVSQCDVEFQPNTDQAGYPQQASINFMVETNEMPVVRLSADRNAEMPPFTLKGLGGSNTNLGGMLTKAFGYFLNTSVQLSNFVKDVLTEKPATESGTEPPSSTNKTGGA